MSYAPGDLEALQQMMRAHAARVPQQPAHVPAGHVSRAQRRALAKRAGVLHASPPEAYEPRTIVRDEID
jgi:hypothetical protein